MAERTEKALKSSFKKHPDDTGILSDLVDLLRSVDKHDQALSYLERYLTAHPNDFDMLILYGETLIDLDAYDDAIATFMKTCALRDCAKCRYSLARAYDLKGMSDEALKEHNRAIELEPECSEAYYRLGMTYARSDKQEEALVAFQKCLKYDQACAKAHSEMALLYDKKDKKDLAISELKKAIEKDPRNARWHCNLGAVYGEQGMIEAKDKSAKDRQHDHIT